MDKKVNNLVTKIQGLLEEHGNHFWYIMLSHKPKLILKGGSKSKIELKEKINRNPKKYKNKDFVYVKINTGNQGMFSGGKLSILCYLMKVNDNNELYQDPNEKRGKTIWFSDQEILEGKFSFKCIKKIINQIYDNKLDMNPFKITTISNLF